LALLGKECDQLLDGDKQLSENNFLKNAFLFALVLAPALAGAGYAPAALAACDSSPLPTDACVVNGTCLIESSPYQPGCSIEVACPYAGGCGGASTGTTTPATEPASEASESTGETIQTIVYGADNTTVTASTFGDLLCNAVNNSGPFGLVFQWIAYISGVLAALKAVHHFRLHADDPRSNKMNTPLMYSFGAMCLLALPSFVSAVENSLYYATAGGGIACSAPSSSSSSASISGLDTIMTNFISNLKDPLMDVTSLVAILCGLFMIVNGLIKSAKYGIDSKTNSMHSILTNIGFGALLFTIGDNLNIIVNSVFGIGSGISTSSVITWSGLNTLVGGSGVSTQFTTAVNAALTFIQLIGCIAFVRGWLIMKKVVEGGSNASLGQGLTHVLGGVLAINIFQFLVVMDQTFGTNLLN
jgi:hypothetical protein